MKIAFILILFSLNALAIDESIFRMNGAKLPKRTFNSIIAMFEAEFQPFAAEANRQFEILSDYDEDWAQGFARRWETDHVVIYGGLAALNDGSEDSFALVLCHEVGHLYGGRPVNDEYNKLSLEGQADYWATQYCFKKVLPKLTKKIPSKDSLEFCKGDDVCARMADAALVLSGFFADNRNISHPKLTTPDETRVVVTNQTHPEPQCRLDTYLAGYFNLSRPLCWFAE